MQLCTHQLLSGGKPLNKGYVGWRAMANHIANYTYCSYSIAFLPLFPNQLCAPNNIHSSLSHGESSSEEYAQIRRLQEGVTSTLTQHVYCLGSYSLALGGTSTNSLPLRGLLRLGLLTEGPAKVTHPSPPPGLAITNIYAITANGPSAAN